MVFVDKEGTRIHVSVGEQLIKQFEGKLTKGDAKVVQLFKWSMLLVIIGPPRIRTKLASFKQILLEQLMNFRVKFRRIILRMRGMSI
ncbi:hypothetical protein IGI04_025806 [Brassica rapa subsp. trilocularis]|uniref:Uncharacterized protein n=1 Tax=Brassica rapa subsp. trilocularis TaxID=1813537 RepID=A0ABQ7KU58_BRACM|nr:hypothetical protein IGI04_025806 [Brassica rapa subsp. trilocularis]